VRISQAQKARWRRKRNPHEEPKKESQTEKEVRSWEDFILKEIHTAVYAKHALQKRTLCAEA